MHETGRKGDIGVAAITADLLEKRIDVLLPVASTCPYDLVATDGTRFWKVQVKYVTEKNGVLKTYLNRKIITNGKIVSRRVLPTEIDVLAIYSPQRKLCCYIPAESAGVMIALRFEYPANGYRKGVRLVEFYREFPFQPQTTAALRSSPSLGP